MASAPRPPALALLTAALTAGGLAVLGAHLLNRRRLPPPAGTWRPVAG
jgi:hypothetical protein